MRVGVCAPACVWVCVCVCVCEGTGRVVKKVHAKFSDWGGITLFGYLFIFWFWFFPSLADLEA